MFQIVLRSKFDARIVSIWRSGAGWHPSQGTKFATRVSAEEELCNLRQSQPANSARISVETAN